MSLKASDLTQGTNHTATLIENLTRTQIVQYAGQVAGYPTVFAHGMLTMGMTGKMLTDYVGDGRLTKFGVRFTNQVWPGDDLTSTATFDNIEDINGTTVANFDVVTTNQGGAVVLKGYAQARID